MVYPPYPLSGLGGFTLPSLLVVRPPKKHLFYLCLPLATFRGHVFFLRPQYIKSIRVERSGIISRVKVSSFSVELGDVGRRRLTAPCAGCTAPRARCPASCAGCPASCAGCPAPCAGCPAPCAAWCPALCAACCPALCAAWCPAHCIGCLAVWDNCLAPRALFLTPWAGCPAPRPRCAAPCPRCAASWTDCSSPLTGCPAPWTWFPTHWEARRCSNLFKTQRRRQGYLFDLFVWFVDTVAKAVKKVLLATWVLRDR